jgi:hopanoid biosynthesis associated protein HpnK
MNESDTGTFLIVTADDFGRSLSVNSAVEQAAGRGILCCASLMINGSAVPDALRIARNLPFLQIGLHLNLTEGYPLSPKKTIPYLITRDGHFKNSPTRIGCALQFDKQVQRQVEMEVSAQFQAFAETKLPFSHVDCHQHFHVHPKLFDMIIAYAINYKVRTIRIPYEPWEISGPICRGHKIRNWFYRKIITKLASHCLEKIRRTEIVTADGVFGLYQTDQITEDWVLRLLDRLEGKPGTFELYTHPAHGLQDKGNQELMALMSPKVRDKIAEKGIRLIRYLDIIKQR